MTNDFKGTLDFVKKYAPGYFSPDVLNDVIAALELAILSNETHGQKISRGMKASWERRRMDNHNREGN